MKIKIFFITAIIIFVLGSCDSEKSDYFNSLTQDGEITVNFTDHKGKKTEIFWALIDGKVDYYTTNSKHFTRSYTGSFDCRLTKLVKAGPYRIQFESPKNEPAFEGEDYYYEVELKFDLPKDLNQKEHNVDGTIYITGHNAAGDGGDISESYDATFQIVNYSLEKKTPKIEEDAVGAEIKMEEVKNPNQGINDNIINGVYCYQLDDLTKSGKFYYSKLKVENTIVTGEITVENEASESYSVKFNGEIKDGKLLVKTTYDNDAGGPYDETWVINQDKLTLEQPAVTLTKIDCN